MKGSNGLDPRDQLIEKSKCPNSPTKRKYLTSEEAWEAARHRTAESGIDIVAYACPGCGHFHLSKKVAGSDVVVKAPVGITTGALRKKAGVTGLGGLPFPERREVTPEGPIMPSNVEAKRKVLAAYLQDKNEVGTEELVEVMQASRHTVWKYMNELGWKATRGPGAKWRPTQPRLVAVEDAGKSAGDDVEAAMLRHPAGRGDGWWEIDAFPPNVSVHDYLLTLKTAGLEVRVQARRLP